jgi:hypothetical protein
MTVQVTINITLGIAGPFLCSGTAPAFWGMKATFDRDFLGRPYIDRSHIKGKLREAMEELGVTSVETWFGKEGIVENGSLIFSDLRLADASLIDALTGKPSPTAQTRIKKDKERRVVEPNALMVMENAFPGSVEPNGQEKNYIWSGDISFVANNEEEAKTISNEISLGLKWIAAFGAEKSIGFGRLKTVAVELTLVPIDLSHKPVASPSPRLTLTISPQEPLLLGDIRIKANYHNSLEYISGNVLKGALAQAINRACTVPRPAFTKIDETNGLVKKAFPLLTKYFSHLRFIHAFPSLDTRRPVVIPYSLVIADGKHYDIACNKDAVLPNGNLPAFQTDWKDGDFPDGFGWVFPLRFAKTRTAIDDRLRRADDGSMFTYQYVCPIGDAEEKNTIKWVGGIYLEGVELESGESLAALQGELECALGLLHYLGKRAGRVTTTVMAGAPIRYKTVHVIPRPDFSIIALQSDALMINPDDLINKGQTAENLRDLYNIFWTNISDNAFELSHFFALQKLRGGFLKRTKQDAAQYYYPYYLTEAGSVFVLKIKDNAKAQELFDLWDKKGLTLPIWTKAVYGEKVWKQCPFVPENGFGEVMINLVTGEGKKAEEGGIINDRANQTT